MRILIIKPGAIGDLLQLTPVVRALKHKYPSALVSLLVGNSASIDLFRHNSLVHEVIVFDKKGEHRSFPALVELWRKLRSSRYDLVINFQRSNLKAWLLASAAFPCRVLVYHKAKDRIVHAVANHLETLHPLGIDASDLGLEFYPGPEAERFAQDLFAENGLAGKPVIAINPGASHPVNRWDAAQFAGLTDILADRLGARVVIVGGKEDVSLAEEIAGMSHGSPLVLTGKTNLLQLGAVLQRCELLVSGDTGPMHMATAVGTRVVALFGAADPQRTGPVGEGHRVIQAPGIECVPCRSRSCSSSRLMECMDAISVETVYDVVASMLMNSQKPCF